MIIRHFKDGDLAKIKVQYAQRNEDTENWQLFNHQDTFVFAENERVLAVIRPFFEHGGRVWLSALIGADCGDKAVPMFKRMEKIINGFFQDGNKRVEFITQTGFYQANRLAELLGFCYEGTMLKYFNGIDFNIWGKVI